MVAQIRLGDLQPQIAAVAVRIAVDEFATDFDLAIGENVRNRLPGGSQFERDIGPQGILGIFAIKVEVHLVGRLDFQLSANAQSCR